jgi:hypothetical protein
MVSVVISRYKKDTSFATKFQNSNVFIYDKCTPSNPYNVPVNNGNEASVYLKYIIDHYDVLDDFTFFIHDEEYSWHHTGSILDRFSEAINSKELYYNVNHQMLETFSHITLKKELLYFYDKYIEPYIPFEKLPNKDWLPGYKGCAQFLVHKSLIRNLPRKFYEDIYEFTILPGSNNNKLAGYILEWTWHIFWVIFPKFILGTTSV